MKCKQCSNELTGRQKEFCSDKCRMAHKRSKSNTEPEHEQRKPEQTKVEHKPEQGATQIDITSDEHVAMRQRRTNPDRLNHGQHMTAEQLASAGLSANRVPIPGDHDYVGCCEQVDGQRRVKVA